jgi:two-component system, NtrC family, response regulator GlrR
VTDATKRIVRGNGDHATVSVPRFAVRVTKGPDQGTTAASKDGRLTIGTESGSTLQLSDGTVSRYHVELEASGEGVVVRDLGSTNGTRLGPAMVRDAIILGPVDLELGATVVHLSFEPDPAPLPLSPATRFGALLGTSAAMREIYGTLEAAAATTAPILITGESGTGKELAARAVHAASRRSDQPFEVVDCGGLPPTLIESELFGHTKGAFTGAIDDREGAFERANGGTLFLDELGELPIELQPKLLRALGEKEVRRIGAREVQKIDVRIVAATNRDLRREVNAGRFRSDLFYRLAVIHVRMPPLRDRLEDLPILASGLLNAIAQERGVDVSGVQLDARLWQHTWPGNVRELRNVLEQLVILKTPPKLEPSAERGSIWAMALSGLEALPLHAAKNEVLSRFEKAYVEHFLERTGGNAAEAARLSGVSRATLFRMIRRYGLREVKP